MGCHYLHETNGVGVALQGEVKATQTVTGKGVSAALEDDRTGSKGLHDLADDRAEDGLGGWVGG